LYDRKITVLVEFADQFLIEEGTVADAIGDYSVFASLLVARR